LIDVPDQDNIAATGDASAARFGDPSPSIDEIEYYQDSALIRQLALEKLHELRQAGFSYQDINERYRNVPSDPEWVRNDAEMPLSKSLPFKDSAARANQRTEDAAVFLRALDGLPHGVAFFDVKGNLLFLNRAFRRVLEKSPESTRIRQELQLFALAMSSVVQLRKLMRENKVEELAERELPTESAHYHLKASFVGLDLFGVGPSILTSLEGQPGEKYRETDLRSSFGLTKSECRVTRLLVQGKSNAAIARALSISPHTARTHVQRILAKLGARSRAEAAARILGNRERSSVSLVYERNAP
jgi:DNA-binding CsgD family transcriptional regulator/PAS domain-containing protein